MISLINTDKVCLTGSVGLKGTNNKRDVMDVQAALNDLSPMSRTGLVEDGKNGPKTMGMIYDFQKCVVGMYEPDMRVDPGGKTVKALNDPTSKLRWERFAPVEVPKIKSSGSAKTGGVAKFDASNMPTVLPGHVPRNATGPLWTNAHALAVFVPHLKIKEGVVPHFYKCSKGVVTIGVGCAVDVRGDGSMRRKNHKKYVDKFMKTYGVKFIKRDGSAATTEDIYADWLRVWDSSNGKPTGARVTKLRTVAGQDIKLAKAQIEYFTQKKMYDTHSFARNLHCWIQMALVDARWNPSGLNPFVGNALRGMWEVLDPAKPNFDPMKALDIFYDGYDGRGKEYYAQYQKRVVWRCERFYEGALAMTSA